MTKIKRGILKWVSFHKHVCVLVIREANMCTVYTELFLAALAGNNEKNRTKYQLKIQDPGDLSLKAILLSSLSFWTPILDLYGPI